MPIVNNSCFLLVKPAPRGSVFFNFNQRLGRVGFSLHSFKTLLVTKLKIYNVTLRIRTLKEHSGRNYLSTHVVSKEFELPRNLLEGTLSLVHCVLSSALSL